VIRTNFIMDESNVSDEVESLSDDKEEELDESEYSNLDSQKKQVIKARVLMAGEGGGQSLFGFKTPKRKEALVKAAQESVQSAKKSGTKGIKTNITKTPQTATKKTSKKVVEDEKDKEDAGSKRKPLSHIQALNYQSNGAGESSDDSEDSDEDEGEDEKGKGGGDLLDEYFEIHHSKRKCVTSDKTLSKLSNPKMDQEELREHLQEVQSAHIQETVNLRTQNTKHFDKWMFQLLCGFNVLIYGVGSKYHLLEIFRKNFLKDKLHLVINGFFPSLTIKSILNTITEDLLDTDTTFKNVMDQCTYIKKRFDNKEQAKLYMVIHNIDGQMLRSKNTQSALGQIASSLNIHLIASIDHINAPLIWDQNCSSLFSWLWYDTTTFEPYGEETSYENSLLVQQSGTLALSSLKHVMRSLTPNAKGIFRLLVDYQMDNENNSSYTGMSFSDLYSRCRERFLVNSDSNLRAQLTEFKDHKLIKVKKGFDGIEYLTVTLDSGTLKQFIEES